MAIITHPDGYLQITEGHNWQDVSDSSILQRIFRGINERRLIMELPLYWYGVNPRFPGEGSDNTFTKFDNPYANSSYTIEDARIFTGSNVQAVGFWNFLYQLLGLMFYDEFSVSSNLWYVYENDAVYKGQSQPRTIDTQTVYQIAQKQITHGTIISTSIINELLKGLWELQFFRPFVIDSVFFAPYVYPSFLYDTPNQIESNGSPLLADRENCSGVYSETVANWYNNLFDPRPTHYIFQGYASASKRTVGARTLYNFFHSGIANTQGVNQQSIPINGDFVLLAQAESDDSLNSTPLFVDLSGKTPSPGWWSIDRKPLKNGYNLPVNYLGFDVTKSPLENFNLNCGSLSSSATEQVIDNYYKVVIHPFLKPQFADLPT